MKIADGRKKSLKIVPRIEFNWKVRKGKRQPANTLHYECRVVNSLWTMNVSLCDRGFELRQKSCLIFVSVKFRTCDVRNNLQLLFSLFIIHSSRATDINSTLDSPTKDGKMVFRTILFIFLVLLVRVRVFVCLLVSCKLLFHLVLLHSFFLPLAHIHSLPERSSWGDKTLGKWNVCPVENNLAFVLPSRFVYFSKIH